MKCLILFAVLIAATTPVAAITYPQIALGGGYQCVLMVSNGTNLNWEGSAKLFTGKRSAWAGQVFANGASVTSGILRISIPGKGSRKYVITGDFFLRTGFLEIDGIGSSSSFDVATAFFYNLIQDGSLIDSTGVAPSDFRDEFLINVEKTSKINTGIAWSPWINTGPFEIVLTLYDSEGTQVTRKSIQFQGHNSQFFEEILEENVPDGFVGHVSLESEEIIYLVVIRLEATTGGGFQLTSTPPADLF